MADDLKKKTEELQEENLDQATGGKVGGSVDFKKKKPYDGKM